MDVIEYNNIKINVPTGWDDITLGAFDKLPTEKPKTSRDRIAYMAQVCGLDAEVLLQAPVELFNAIHDRVDFFWKGELAPPSTCVTINGIKHEVAVQDKLTLGEWVDCDQVQKDAVDIMSGILSIVLRPVGEAYDVEKAEARREYFKTLPMSQFRPVLSFFLECAKQSQRILNVFSNLLRAVDQLHQSTQASQRLGGGIKLFPSLREIRFYTLMKLLDWRLRRFSRTYSIKGTRTRRKRRSASSISK